MLCLDFTSPHELKWLRPRSRCNRLNSPKIVKYMVKKWCRSVSYTKRLTLTGNVFSSLIAMRIFTALHTKGLFVCNI